MTISSVYSHYKIPPNLERHMLQVTAVGMYVCDSWNGPAINRDLIRNALLLHDMGNILKFKRPFLGELEQNAAHWEQVQHDYQAKYGTDVQQATLAIVQELGLTDVYQLLVEMRSAWEQEAEVSWETRICEYADCCVTPNGIEGFETRISDLKNRYDLEESSTTIVLLRKNAEMVQEHVSTEVLTLQTQDFSTEMKRLKEVEV
ncbi:hypothetical protein KBD71_03355 [Candidatus Woesebacteria bacterium]|nr:hypothetical protein [Candidatus Woesebacteria bacterium]